MNQIKKSDKAEVFVRFFKTGVDEYGEGDKFLGLCVPEQRKLAEEFIDLDFGDIEKLLASVYHEHRLTGLLILVYRFGKANEKAKKDIYNFYLSNTEAVNNWDLVDLSAHKIVGLYLQQYPQCSRKILDKLAGSQNLWQRRIAMIACFEFIRNKEFDDAIRIATKLVNDDHDLMHKAVGWMLREIGKRDLGVEEDFLKKYYTTMPRTMLRYAIERFPEEKRRVYMNKFQDTKNK